MKYFIIYDDGSKEEVTMELCQQMIDNEKWIARKVENDICVFSE